MKTEPLKTNSRQNDRGRSWRRLHSIRSGIRRCYDFGWRKNYLCLDWIRIKRWREKRWTWVSYHGIFCSWNLQLKNIYFLQKFLELLKYFKFRNNIFNIESLGGMLLGVPDGGRFTLLRKEMNRSNLPDFSKDGKLDMTQMSSLNKCKKICEKLRFK